MPEQANALLELLDADHATPTLVWNGAYRSSVESLISSELAPLSQLLAEGARDEAIRWAFEHEGLIAA